jgi:hypothetical protein
VSLATQELEALLERLSATSVLRPYTLGLLAQALLRQSRTQEALGHVKEALSLFAPLGGVDMGESLIRLVYAQALLQNGQLGSAKLAAQRAKDALLVRANKINDDELRDIFLQKIPENAQTLAFAKELEEGGDKRS